MKVLQYLIPNSKFQSLFWHIAILGHSVKLTGTIRKHQPAGVYGSSRPGPWVDLVPLPKLQTCDFSSRSVNTSRLVFTDHPGERSSIGKKVKVKDRSEWGLPGNFARVV